MLDITETDDGTKCWDCEKLNDGGNNVCTSCGHSLCFDCQVNDLHNCEEGNTAI